ncbi:MAG: hypothetical protein AB8B51_06390 [Sedimentitalea sp.]
MIEKASFCNACFDFCVGVGKRTILHPIVELVCDLLPLVLCIAKKRAAHRFKLFASPCRQCCVGMRLAHQRCFCTVLRGSVGIFGAESGDVMAAPLTSWVKTMFLKQTLAYQVRTEITNNYKYY